MNGASNVLAQGEVNFPPSVEDFYLPSIVPWGAHNNYWFTKITFMVWLAVGILILFFLLSYRNPKLVPTKKQWLAESIYGFVRNNIAVDMIGHAGVRFAPYFTTLFCFVLLTNFFAIVPLFQISPNSHIAFPAFLALISYVLFNYVGIKQHGFVKYFKNALVPPAPWYILPLLIRSRRSRPSWSGRSRWPSVSSRTCSPATCSCWSSRSAASRCSTPTRCSHRSRWCPG